MNTCLDQVNIDRQGRGGGGAGQGNVGLAGAGLPAAQRIRRGRQRRRARVHVAMQAIPVVGPETVLRDTTHPPTHPLESLDIGRLGESPSRDTPWRDQCQGRNWRTLGVTSSVLPQAQPPSRGWRARDLTPPIAIGRGRGGGRTSSLALPPTLPRGTSYPDASRAAFRWKEESGKAR